MVVSGYQLDLYCESCNEFVTFTDESKRVCFKLARLDGWTFTHKNRIPKECFCASCSGRKK